MYLSLSNLSLSKCLEPFRWGGMKFQIHLDLLIMIVKPLRENVSYSPVAVGARGC